MKAWNTAFIEFEPAALSAVVATETLMQARDDAYLPPNFKVAQTPMLSNAPSRIEIDRDFDGTADASVTPKAKSHHLALDELEVDSNNDGKPDYTINVERQFLWGIQRMTVDKDGDGKVDFSMKVNRSWLGKIESLDVDSNNDGKTDAVVNLRYDRTNRTLNGMTIDRSASGLSNLKLHGERDSRFRLNLK
ncbi:MAG TPA: hypothetical protein EYN91_01660 [Candidatus Melainabacteria bacterium]|jgi:hypothetical protein|nr:hypothetical protein [Candidatus Melainabacteria bacterium]HIN64333.1 hypothetical protein [Candidatus Obscuribacterales bacterium]